MKHKNRLILVLLCLCVCLIFLTPLPTNLWLELTSREYTVPPESSMITFRPTVMNTGSGEWWIYGEDYTAYYFAGDKNHPESIVLTKKTALECEGFEATNYLTWCTDR